MDDDSTRTQAQVPPTDSPSAATPGGYGFATIAQTPDMGGAAFGTMAQTPSAIRMVESGTPLLPTPAEPELRADDAPAGYVIEKTLGRGGMGVVYLARQTALNRRVAVKMILGGAHAGSQAVVRFLAEAEAIARVQHPNIVQVYDVGEHRGMPYFSLEFCGGGALNSKLSGTPLPPREAAVTVAAVASGMAAAHTAGIIHRDLKPHNVLLDTAGTPKVTDFGLAKQVDSGSELTATGAVLGTPSYMAPEQARGEPVGPPADIWAIGAVLYECLTGRPPFKAASAMETVFAVIEQEPVPPSQLAPATPRDLETICLKCLEKDPARRYPTSAAVADDLNRWLNGLPIAARPVGRVERAVKWAKRNPSKAAVVVLLGALGLAGVGGGVAIFEYRAQAAEFALAKSNSELEQTQKKGRDQAAVNRQWTDARTEKTAGRLTSAQREYARLFDLVKATPEAVEPADEQTMRAESAEVDATITRDTARAAEVERAKGELAKFRTLRNQTIALRLARAVYPADRSAGERVTTAGRAALAAWTPTLSAAPLTPEERAELDIEVRDLAVLVYGPVAAAVVGGPAVVPLFPAGSAGPAVFARGLAAFEANDPAAKTLAEILLQINSGYDWGRMLLAAVRVRAGQTDGETDRLLSDRLSIDPGDRLASALRGRTRAADPAKSEADFAAALAPPVDSAVRLYTLATRGRARADREDWAAAEADLRLAQDGNPDDPTLPRDLARVLARQKKTADAVAVLTAGLGRFPNSSGLLLDRGRLRGADGRADFQAAAAGTDGPAAQATLELARQDWNAGDRAAALDAARRLADRPVPPHGALLFLAQSLYATGQFNDSRTALERHLKAVGSAGEREAFALRGLLCTRLRLWTEAVQAYNDALDRQPGPAERRDLLLARARVYVLARSYGPAALDYDAVLAADPADPDGLIGRAEMRVRDKKLRAGLADVAVVEQNPAATPRQLALAAHVRAVVYQAVDTNAEHARKDGFVKMDAQEQFKLLCADLERAVAAVPPADRPAFWAECVKDDAAFGPVIGYDRLVRLERQAMRK